MYEHIFKRVLDVVLCSAALIILFPVFIITAVVIKISSPGPVFFASCRTGKNHEKFDFYKFRSMHVTNADKGLFIADKERLFAAGRIIRRLKIDELPQLINVIQGKMSIVGPRPMPHSVVDQIYFGKYQKILSVKPGLTSAASLYDYTVGDTYTDNDAYMREILPIKLEMEMLYIEKQSFLYDSSLVCRTIITIMKVLLGQRAFKKQPELAEIKATRGELY